MKLKLKHENELELLNAYKNHYQNEVLKHGYIQDSDLEM